MDRVRRTLLAAWMLAALLSVVPAAAGAHTFAWQNDATLPSTVAEPSGRFEAQGLTLGSKLYVLGGFYTADSIPSQRSDVYDRTTNTWTPIANLPIPVTHAGQAAVGGSIYLAGGFLGQHPGTPVMNVLRYDVAANTWSQDVPALPQARAGGGLVALGRTLHVFGGVNGPFGTPSTADRGEHWALDLDNLGAGWVAKAPLPNPRNHVAGVAFEGMACGVGGQYLENEDTANQDDVDCYKPATNSWIQLPSLPRPRGHMSASTFVHDGRIYAVGGAVEGRARSADVTMYDPASQTWIARSLLPDGRKTPVAGMIGDTLQVATGNGPSLMSATNWSGRFDGSWETVPTLGVWSPLAAPMGEVAGGMIGDRLYLVGAGSGGTFMYMDMSLPRWIDFGIAGRPFDGDHHAAEVVAGKLYLFGGLGAGSPGKVQVYDPVANTWTTKADMPFAAGSVSSAVIGGKVYVAGGVVGSATTSQAAVYDPVANTWQSLAPMPQGRNHAAAATDGAKLYVFGGRDGGNAISNGFDTVQVYDPATNTWRSSASSGLAPLPQARGGMGKAVYYDGELYVMGGETASGAGATADRVYARVDIYNPACNTWRLGEDMPTARHGIYPLVRAGRIYVAGGGAQAGGGADSDRLEVYDPPAKPACTPAPDPGGGTPGGTGDPGTGTTTTPTTTTPPAQNGVQPGPTRLASTLRARFATTRSATRVLKLDALKLAAGTRIEVRCTGRGCPRGKARYRVARARSALSLRSAKLRAAKLRPGAVLEVRIMRAGQVGLVIAHRTRAGRKPVRATRCLPPGATRPARCA